MDDATVGLSSAIEGLRAELSGAMLAGHGQGLLFELGPIDLTVQVLVQREGSGKVSWHILEGGAKQSSQLTQTLTLRLTPVLRSVDGSEKRDVTIDSPDFPDDKFGPE